MSKRAFCIVDVFAEEKYAGNQLAVVTDAEGLDPTAMQQIANEMNYSETTFLLSDRERDGMFDLRIFTPREEVPFAGHPILGTAWVVRHRILGDRQRPEIVLRPPVGPIPVRFVTEADGGEVLWMRQRPPEFGATLPIDQAAALLRLDPAEIDTRAPVQDVSTGLWFLLVPLRSIEAVRRARIDPDRYAALVRERPGKAVLLFSAETEDPDNQVHARMFAEHYGVPEDPATGSANGCLAAWLVEHGWLGDGPVNARVEQGHEMGRPSLLRLAARRENGGIVISVGGRVVPVAEGNLL